MNFVHIEYSTAFYYAVWFNYLPSVTCCVCFHFTVSLPISQNTMEWRKNHIHTTDKKNWMSEFYRGKPTEEMRYVWLPEMQDD